MRILLDHSAPQRLRSLLPEHEVQSAAFRGWERLENGHLLQAAHDEGYEMVITCDQGIMSITEAAPRRSTAEKSRGPPW